MKKRNPFLRILAGLVGGILGYAVVSSMYEAGRRESAVKDFLSHAVVEANKKLPMMVDTETRLDIVSAGPGQVFAYNFSLPNTSKAEMNVESVQQNLRFNVIKNYKTSAQMQMFRDRNVEMHYKYKDKNGEFLFEIIVTPKDF